MNAEHALMCNPVGVDMLYESVPRVARIRASMGFDVKPPWGFPHVFPNAQSGFNGGRVSHAPPNAHAILAARPEVAPYPFFT